MHCSSPCGRGGRHALHTLLLQRIDQRADSAGCAGVVPVVHRLGHWRAGRAAAADATAAAVAAAAATAAATTPAAAAIAAAAKASSSNIATTSRAILGNMIQAGDGKLVCANVLSKTQILGNVIQAGDGDFVCAAILSNPQPLGNGLQSSDGDNVRVNVLSKTQLLGHGVDLLREALRRGLDELPCSYQRRVGVRRQLLHRARPNKPTAAAAVEAANVAVAGNAGQRRRAQVIFSISAAVDAGGDGSCSSSSSSSGGSGCSCDIAVLKRHDPVRSAKALASQAAPGGRRAAPAACAALAASVLDGVHRAECADAKRAAVPRLLGSCHRGIVRCAQFLECGLQRPPQRLAPLVDGTALGRRVGGGVRLASLAELLCAERQHADLDCTRHLLVRGIVSGAQSEQRKAHTLEQPGRLGRCEVVEECGCRVGGFADARGGRDQHEQRRVFRVDVEEAELANGHEVGVQTTLFGLCMQRASDLRALASLGRVRKDDLGLGLVRG
mmetsp:Transcript_20670/g.61689  ORF Transcript_20670/g.61689 Transcript_20670/m.61689 type:complete len:499 (-) Transcript_20670:706-2202(-)